MEQDEAMPAGVAGGAAMNPMGILQAGFSPEMFVAMQSIFHGFEQQFIAMENNIVPSQGIENAIQSGFAHSNFHINVSPAVPLCHGSARTPLGTHANEEDLGLEESRKAICT
jgi:hypothetical protein